MFRAILTGASCLVLAFPAAGKDVSAQQVGLEVARENQEKAETMHKANLQQVADSEKRLAEAQKRLEEDRQKSQASKKAVDEANARLIKAQELLDKAWKE